MRIRYYWLPSVLLCVSLSVLSHGQVIINEIMYAPYEPFGTTNDTEYLELYNAGASAVSLDTYRFEEGITFVFDPGTTILPNAYLVVCEDLVAFTQAYPSVTGVVGDYDGALNNGGERVTLSRQQSNEWVTVDTIRFIDGGPSDGTGTSLELVHPGFARLPNHYYGAWAASTAPSGTPGMVNAVYDPNPPPVAGDVLHEPPLPFPGSVVTIRTRVAGFGGNTLPVVRLDYRKDAYPRLPWQQAAMSDDGSGGDETAGDGTYAAQVPGPGDPAMQAGEMIEFRVTVQDTNGLSRTVPAINRAGVADGPYSYLCYFGEDAEFTGEYPTYHILLTEENRTGPSGLETRSDGSNVLLDSTFITTGGRVIYNCGVRYRGFGSRVNPYSFRVEFPRGETWKGYQDINLLHNEPLLQHIGMRTVDRSGGGNVAPATRLCRVWLNETLKSDQVQDLGQGGVYVRAEKIGHDFIAKHYPDDTGNIYRGERTGNLDYRADLADYYGSYRVETNNPFTVWHSLSNLCSVVSRDASLLPDVLGTRVNVDQWARHYAMHVGLENGEGGLMAARLTTGDDYYMYADPVDGQFDLLPWDFDSIVDDDHPQVGITRSIWAYESNAGGAQPVVSNFLLNPPMVSRYVGNLLEVMDTVLAPPSMEGLFDEMGSALSPVYRAKLQQHMAIRRDAILGEINTQLTVSVVGAVDEGPLVSVVTDPSVALTGAGPQGWTTRVLVDGEEAGWSTRTGTWATTNNLILAEGANAVTVEAFDHENRLLQSVTHPILVQTQAAQPGGVITVDTVWDAAGGVLQLSSDVTITSSARLTVPPGAVVTLDPGVRIRVESGVLDVQGSAAAPVHFYPSDGASSWHIEAEGGGASVSGAHAWFHGGHLAVTQGAALTLVDSEVTDYRGPEDVISTESAGPVSLLRCRVADYGAATFSRTPVLIEACLFENMSTRGIGFVGSTATVQQTTVRYSAGSWPVDGIRLTGGSLGTLTGCMLHHLSGDGLVAGAVPQGTAVSTVLTPVGSIWKYLDDGSDQGSAWTASGFDDAAWSDGPAQLGYGDGDEATVVGYGPDSNNKYPTTYFRRSFVIPEGWDVVDLDLRLLCDDGGVVHLNGAEIFRSNLPAGPVDYQAWALEAVGGADEDAFLSRVVDPALVVPGTNQLAVEIHQISGTSSDVSFDLELAAEVIEHPGSAGDLSTVTVEDCLVHRCRTGIYNGEAAAVSGDHNSITDCGAGIRGSRNLRPELTVRDSYLPGVPVLVRVDVRDDGGRMARDLWDATARLSASDPEITLSTDEIRLYNGRGSALVTFSGGGSFELTAAVDGRQVSKALLSLEGVPATGFAGTLAGPGTTWSNVVHVSGDLLVPAGHTLTIDPGALVLLDGVPSGSGGTDILVEGEVRCLGTRDRPVTFTAADPTQAWGELHHDGAAPSFYQYAMITRAGHSPAGGHTGSGPAVRSTGSTLLFEGACITDLDGKVMTSSSGSDVTFLDCLLSRAVMGPEVENTAALLEETWITEMLGPDDNDGIYFHDQQAGQEIVLRGGVNAVFDDDAIDTLRATVRIEDHISRDAFDKGLSAYGGLVDIRRFISADNGTGISIKESGTGTGRINLDHATVVGNGIGIQVRDKTGEPDVFLEYYVTNSIIEPGGADPVQTDYDPADIHIAYSNIGETWPGAGNTNADALFVDPLLRDFRLRPGSPCIDAGDPGYALDPDGSVTEMGFHPFAPDTGQMPTHLNTLAWANAEEVVGDAAFDWSIVRMEGTNTWPGVENLNRNPWFRDPAEGDYRLLPVSPAAGSASDGTDRGASFPSGAGPASPSGLVLQNTMVADENRVELTWQDHSADEAYFELQRSADGAPWEVFAVAPAEATGWVDTGLAQNTAYHYRVRAVHRRGESLYTDQATVLTAMTTTLQALIDGLRITEIMYNPADSSDDAHEFLELQNIGTALLDLSGLRFADGVDFDFADGTTLAAGEFLLIVKDPLAFAARYPGVPWYGVFQNGTGLRNSGETIEIQDAEGNRIYKVSYDDGQDARWYPTTDGDGYALVMNDPDGDPDDASTWRAGSSPGGSPGAEDPPASYGTVVISEVLSHTDPPLEDAIELHNTGTTTVDIADWYVSDDEDDVKKHQIVGSLAIPPDGRHVLYAGTSFGLSGFAISEFGERIYLSSASGTNLTSYRTWVKFGAADNGVSFGRHRRSDGVVDFVAMSNRTFGADQPATVEQFRTGTGLPNAYPRVGPVVINEIMYNPSATGKEFIELHNTAGAEVPLFDPLHPANRWSFDGAVEYVFPAGTWIAPGEHVLIVGVEPDAFREQFGLTNQSVQVLGPFDGDLANGGESVKLYRPGNPEPNGTVPRIRVDRVKYDDESPWPEAADNDGPSLERVDPRLYGNDPATWAACTIGGTPGAPNNTGCLPSVGFTRTRDSGLESNAAFSVELTLFPPVPDPVTVQYVVGGTAAAGADYSLGGGTAVFWPHDRTVVLPLVIYDDLAPELDEDVVITLTSVSSNAHLGGNATYTYTIVDTDHTGLPAPAIMPSGTNEFVGSVLVTMTSAVHQARIYYTLNGALPTDEDVLYTGPFELPCSARVRARSYLGEVNASGPADALFLEQVPTGPPRVSNQPGAASIGTTFADLNGSVVSTGQAPASISVYWGPVDQQEDATQWENGHAFQVQPPGPLALHVTGLMPETTYYYRFHGTNALGEHWAAPSASFVTLPSRPQIENTCGSGGGGAGWSVTNVSRGAGWRYLDDGSDQGTGWTDPGFDDSGWSSGPAQLGFGDNDEATVIGFGPDADNKYTTTYFRRSFTVPSAGGVTGLTVRLLRDDGAVVHLNGVEIARDNMPGGAIDAATFASSVVSSADEDTFFTFVPTNNPMVPGTNVLAVELHQANLVSSDLGFDLELVSHLGDLGGGVSNLTPTSAEVFGTLLSSGDAPSEVFVHYGRTDGGADGGAWEATLPLGVRSEGTVQAFLGGLQPGATYFYRFAAGNTYGNAIADCSGEFTLPGDLFVSGVITGDTVWVADVGPYQVVGDITVASGATLTIEPGVDVLFDQGVGMTVNGRLVADGTADRNIRFTRSPGAGTWSRLMFVEAEDSVLRHCVIEYADCEGDHKDYYDDDCNPATLPPSRVYFQAVVVIACHLDIEHCLFRNLPDDSGLGEGDAIAVISDDPDVPGEATANIRYCDFISIGQGVHTRHAYVLVEHCYFTGHHGDNDDIDLYGECIPPPLIRYNRMISPAHDDMINPTRCSAILIGNIIANSDDHGIVLRDRCRPVLINNLVYNCVNAGIAVQNQCDAFLLNNVIVNSARGVRFFDHDGRWEAPYCLYPGSGKATLVNNIIWDCPTPLELSESPYTGDPGSHATVTHCVVEGGQGAASVSAASTLTWDAGNADVDPQFVDLAGADFHLEDGSPCIDAGIGYTASFSVTNHLGERADVVVSVTDDHDRSGRPLDGDGDGQASFDIGPYERLLPAADSNGDGVPDGWYAGYGLNPADPDVGSGNPDADPSDTGSEYVADTDPTNQTSYLTVLRLEAAPDPLIHFGPSSALREYTLQYTGELPHGAWSNRLGQTHIPGNGSGQDTLVDTGAPAGRRHYRIEVRVP